MNFIHYIYDDILFLTIEGDLLGFKKEFELVKLVENYLHLSVRKFIIDLSNIQYINSKGLTILLGILTRIRDREGHLRVLNPSSQVNRLFFITKLNLIFKFANSKHEAIQILRKS